MIDRHAEAQELLAGYALQSLSDEDAAKADRLLAEHVPGCSECRQMLDAFQAVAGELALDAEPIPPPDPLLPRIHREMEPRGRSVRTMDLGAARRGGGERRAGGRRRRAGHRATGDRKTAQVPAADVQELVDFANHHKTQAQTLGGDAGEISARGVQELYVYGRDVPAPRARVRLPALGGVGDGCHAPP